MSLKKHIINIGVMYWTYFLKIFLPQKPNLFTPVPFVPHFSFENFHVSILVSVPPIIQLTNSLHTIHVFPLTSFPLTSFPLTSSPLSSHHLPYYLSTIYLLCIHIQSSALPPPLPQL